MNKRIIPGLLLVVVAVIGAYYFFTFRSQEIRKDEHIEVNNLPNMVITLLDGSQFQARQLAGNNVLILYQPDCDHCQRQAQALREKIAAFSGYTLYFLTTYSKQEVQNFATSYQLDDLQNVRFGMISYEDVIGNFGPITAPSLYLYRSSQLVKGFNGETDVQKIIKAL